MILLGFGKAECLDLVYMVQKKVVKEKKEEGTVTVALIIHIHRHIQTHRDTRTRIAHSTPSLDLPWFVKQRAYRVPYIQNNNTNDLIQLSSLVSA